MRWLHLVDLDGARDGTPGNRELIRQHGRAARIRIQLGGGLRSRALVDEALAGRRQPRGDRQRGGGRSGAAARAARRDYGAERICLAIDVRVDDSGMPRVRTRGWVQEHALSLWELLASPSPTHRCGMCCAPTSSATARWAAPGFDLYAEAQRRFPAIAWQASGGIRSAADLQRLDAMGLAAAISGKALLEGRISMEELQPYLRDA